MGVRMLPFLKACKGRVNVGSGFNSGSYTLPIASSVTLGGVKIGNGISKLADGTISVDSSGGGFDYSLEEVETGQKWIDGKNVYCRVFSVGSSPINITMSYVDYMVKIDGTKMGYPLNCYDDSTYNVFTRFDSEDKVLKIRVRGLSLNETGYVICYYTKIS